MSCYRPLLRSQFDTFTLDSPTHWKLSAKGNVVEVNLSNACSLAEQLSLHPAGSVSYGASSLLPSRKEGRPSENERVPGGESLSLTNLSIFLQIASSSILRMKEECPAGKGADPIVLNPILPIILDQVRSIIKMIMLDVFGREQMARLWDSEDQTVRVSDR